MMEEKMPGCGVKATSHIESQVKTLKKQTMAITDMFTTGSEFSWNEKDKMKINGLGVITPATEEEVIETTTGNKFE
ncbi:hypothetical protein L1049_020922 [Liquidambar formosana]|uniref:Uncharacterized protein n=1 Tax=Liquidambar formosana TaxID=63359 RepID=A0AAP0SDS2_LIQFO